MSILNARDARLLGVRKAIDERGNANPSVSPLTMAEIMIGTLGPHGSLPAAIAMHAARHPFAQSLAARGPDWLIQPSPMLANLRQLPLYQLTAPTQLLPPKLAV